MTGKNLPSQCVLVFVTLLVVALALQSGVLLLLGLRGAVQAEISFAQTRLTSLAAQADAVISQEGVAGWLDSRTEPVGEKEDCLLLIYDGEETIREGCGFTEQLRTLARQSQQPALARPEGAAGLRQAYAGASWRLLSYRSESVLLALPLVVDGRVYGSLAMEHSLLPVYQRLGRDGRIALVYLLASAIICASLFYLRLNRLVFRPMGQLAELAENYRPDEEAFFHPAGEGGLFRRLSSGMHGMVQRIQEDNRRLRASVDRLEDANRELQEKKNLLVRSEKLASVGRLSAGLAHEIGNPLAIIQGYVDLLGRGDCSAEERADYSAKAQQELDRIQALSRRLLDFARPRPTTTMVAVNDLAAEVLAFMAVENSFAGCRLVKQLGAGRDLLLADPDALRQVLINCLFNAADAMAGYPESDREIVVRTANVQGDNRRETLLLTVADRGPGVAAEHLEEIFEPFYSTKESGKGTGLGLFVCQTIVDGLGGSIGAENQPEGGLVIRIELPLPVEEENTSG